LSDRLAFPLCLRGSRRFFFSGLFVRNPGVTGNSLFPFCARFFLTRCPTSLLTTLFLSGPTLGNWFLHLPPATRLPGNNASRVVCAFFLLNFLHPVFFDWFLFWKAVSSSSLLRGIPGRPKMTLLFFLCQLVPPAIQTDQTTPSSRSSRGLY